MLSHLHFSLFFLYDINIYIVSDKKYKKINMFSQRFKSLRIKNLRGYFNAIYFAFNHFENQDVNEVNFITGKAEYMILVNDEKRTALFKGVVMRKGKLFYI